MSQAGLGRSTAADRMASLTVWGFDTGEHGGMEHAAAQCSPASVLQPISLLYLEVVSGSLHRSFAYGNTEDASAAILISSADPGPSRSSPTMVTGRLGLSCVSTYWCTSSNNVSFNASWFNACW